MSTPSRHPLLKGAVLLAVVELVAGGIFFWIITSGVFPMNADTQPGAFENWLGNVTSNSWDRSNAPHEPDPVPVNDATLMQGARIYQANCAVCHGGANYTTSPLHEGVYPGAPQFLKKAPVRAHPNVLFYLVKNGIRFTGMPAWHYNLSDDQIWSVVNFAQHIDSLPPELQKAWQQMPMSPVGSTSNPE